MKKNITDEELNEAKVCFTDIFLQEMGFEVTEDDLIYDPVMDGVIQFKEKLFKYFDGDSLYLRHNEIEFNLLENPKLMAIIFSNTFIPRYNSDNDKGIEIESFYQSTPRGAIKGYACVVLKSEDGKPNEEIKSDKFINESVRILNLMAKLNGTSHWYDLDKIDIDINSR